jgi:hypothetical protein
MIDLRLETKDEAEYFQQCMAIVTLRNGNKCWTPWVHQSRHKGWDCELRYASGDEVPYSQDGAFRGNKRGFDIVALERGVDADEARVRGMTELDWPGAA